MTRRRLSAILMATMALAFPAGALADSAGDNQYQDPLANSPSPHKPQKKTTTTQTTPAPAPAATQAPAQTSSSSASSSSAAQSSGTLPRTGLPLAPLVAAGIGLIAAGVLIRRLA